MNRVSMNVIWRISKQRLCNFFNYGVLFLSFQVISSCMTTRKSTMFVLFHLAIEIPVLIFTTSDYTFLYLQISRPPTIVQIVNEDETEDDEPVVRRTRSQTKRRKYTQLPQSKKISSFDFDATRLYCILTLSLTFYMKWSSISYSIKKQVSW